MKNQLNNLAVILYDAWLLSKDLKQARVPASYCDDAKAVTVEGYGIITRTGDSWAVERYNGTLSILSNNELTDQLNTIMC